MRKRYVILIAFVTFLGGNFSGIALLTGGQMQMINDQLALCEDKNNTPSAILTVDTSRGSVSSCATPQQLQVVAAALEAYDLLLQQEVTDPPPAQEPEFVPEAPLPQQFNNRT